MRETWKEIKGYDGCYKVSDKGQVLSIRSNKLLSQGTAGGGYKNVNLSIGGKRKTFNVHQLIAIAFLSHKPNGHVLVVDHINGVVDDNQLSNLQIITQRKNSTKDKKNKTSKYTGVCYAKDRNKWKSAIYYNNKKYNLGYFDKEEDAFSAYKLKKEAIKETVITE